MQLDEEVRKFDRFLDATSAVPPAIAARLRKEFATYTAGVRETAGFAAYDASYGALLAGPTDAWSCHLDRAAAMRFDTVAIAPPFATGRAGDGTTRAPGRGQRPARPAGRPIS